MHQSGIVENEELFHIGFFQGRSIKISFNKEENALRWQKNMRYTNAAVDVACEDASRTYFQTCVLFMIMRYAAAGSID